MNLDEMLGSLTVGGDVTIDLEANHPLYDDYIKTWQMSRDVCQGEKAVKKRTTEYLAKLSGQTEEEYYKYLQRAVFYNASYRTKESYLGHIFRKDVRKHWKLNGEESVEFSEKMEKLFQNVTTDGLSLNNFIHQLTEEVIITNRVGVLIDIPTIADMANEPSMTLEDYKKRKPIFIKYNTESIKNWHVEYYNGQVLPVLVVLYEPREQFTRNSLVQEQKPAYRILFLENWDNLEKRQYKVITIITDPATGRKKVESIQVPKHNGQSIKSLPFYMLTDKGIDFREVHNSMMYDLASLNLAHYRNSADLENELHSVSLKTICFPGWDKSTYGEPKIGGGLACPPDNIPVLLEPTSDSSIREEMILKEQRLAVLGSERISMKGKYVASAETANITASSEASVLQNMVVNLSGALTQIVKRWLEWYEIVLDYEFGGKVDTDIVVNSSFFHHSISGADLLNYVQALQSGGISRETYYYALDQREVYPNGHTPAMEWEAIDKTADLYLDRAIEKLSNGSIDNPIFKQKAEEMGLEIDNKVTQTSGVLGVPGRGEDQTVRPRGDKPNIRIS